MQNASKHVIDQPEVQNSLDMPVAYSHADIHMHTNLGDGWASPARVIEEATRKGLRLIAITIRVIAGGWVGLVAHRRSGRGDGCDIGRVRIVISIAAAVVS